MEKRKNWSFYVIIILLLTGMFSCNSAIAAGLSKIPIDLEKVSGEDVDKEIIRVGIIAEYDAVNLYEQMAAKATDPNVKKVLLDIASEEKIHIGEFQALLMELDPEQVALMKEGEEEIREMFGGKTD